MQVINVMPGKMLVMTGGLGPLQFMAASGSMVFKISPQASGAKLEITYSVTGYFPGGTTALTSSVDGVLNTQFARFKSFVETGNPATATAPKK